jgi:hypothetical protein
VIRDPKVNHFENIVVHSELVPASTDWKQYARTLEIQP